MGGGGCFFAWNLPEQLTWLHTRELGRDISFIHVLDRANIGVDLLFFSPPLIDGDGGLLESGVVVVSRIIVTISNDTRLHDI